jgi:hypothetical protein
VNDEKRALHLYELAIALVKTKGALVPIGSELLRQYRSGTLTIHYLPRSGLLHVWAGPKVLAIERRVGSVRVTRYTPGEWEEELEEATNVEDR